MGDAALENLFLIECVAEYLVNVLQPGFEGTLLSGEYVSFAI